MKTSKATVLLTVATLIVVVLLFLGAEFWLRSSERFATYFEKNGLAERRQEFLVQPWIYAHVGQGRTIKRHEYTETLRFNPEGLVGELPPVGKGRNEFRIAIVGDSFTEGTGDVESLGYVGRLARLLAPRAQRTFEVINGGVGGSDPVYELELLRRRLLKYRPDLILMALNRTDFEDLERRGGRERFQADGQLRPRTRAAWESLFYECHLVRAFMVGGLGYNWELHSPAESKVALAHAFEELVAVGKEANQLAESHGARFRYLIHSLPDDFDRIDSGNLSEIRSKLEAAQVPYLDLRHTFRRLAGVPLDPSYSWPRDGHFTGKGYQIFAQALLAELDRSGLLKR